MGARGPPGREEAQDGASEQMKGGYYGENHGTCKAWPDSLETTRK